MQSRNTVTRVDGGDEGPGALERVPPSKRRVLGSRTVNKCRLLMSCSAVCLSVFHSVLGRGRKESTRLRQRADADLVGPSGKIEATGNLASSSSSFGFSFRSNVANGRSRSRSRPAKERHSAVLCTIVH